jgi:long-chain acyl-CoA synthetase
MSDMLPTIPDLFLRVCTNAPQSPALWIKSNGTFVSRSWEQLAQEVALCVARLAASGLQRGHRLVFISENRWEWIVVDLACQFAGVVLVPLHVTLTGEQWIKCIQHAEPSALLISNATLWQKLRDLPLNVEAIYSFDPCDDMRVSHWNSLADRPLATALTTKSIDPREIATVLYTSGTTGEPKGVMLSYENLAFNAQAAAAMASHASDELKLNVLPFSHAYARTCDIYLWLARGSQLVISSRESLLADLQTMQPTTLHGVPYLFERLWSSLQERGGAEDPGSLRRLLGGRIRSCSSGGAPLPIALCAAFQQQGVPLLEGYGLTETSPIITLSTREQFQPGSCGLCLTGTELRIADDGEVLTRGPHVMLGYYRDAAATAQILQDGWLHTGDLGTLNAQGFLTLQGRKKELLALSTGKKIMPRVLEDRFVNDHWIAQIVVVGEGRSRLGALVVPHANPLNVLMEKHGCPSPQAVREHPAVLEEYLQHIGSKLLDLSPQEQIRHITFVSPLTPERGELSAKLSYCRPVILANYRDAIEQMFAASSDKS